MTGGRSLNVAARLMARSEPGSVLVSADVRRTIRGPLAERLVSRGSLQREKMTETAEALSLNVGPVTSAAPSPRPGELALPDKPSISVLPFSDMTGAKGQDYFADGMVVEIVTALSRFQTLFVIASTSSLSYRGDARSPAEIARELGVRYLLLGSVRKAGDRVRIAVELLDDGAHTPIWAQRFDGTLEDVFALQDTVANAVASQIEPLRGLHAQWGGYERERLLEAIGLFDHAIARDPDFALALAHASNAHINMYLHSQTDDPEASLRSALDLARRAVRAARNDPEVLAFAAYSHLHCGSDLATVDALIERALALSPGSSVCRYNSGWIYVFACRPEAALAELEKGLRLDPRSPWRVALILGQGFASFHLRRFAEAIAHLSEAIDSSPPMRPMTSRMLAACYAYLGRLAEARAVADGLEAATPSEARCMSLFRGLEFQAILNAGVALAAAEVAGR